MKRIIMILIAAILLAAVMLPLTAHAEPAVTDPTCIYFQAPYVREAAWKDYKTVYCHLTGKSAGDIFKWQDDKEICEESGGLWKYSLSDIEFDPEDEYSLVFSNESGEKTYALNITSSCLGDIVYCGGDICADPADTDKICAVARWNNNGNKVHPAVETDPDGNTINPDNTDPADAQTVWGNDEGKSYDLPETSVLTDGSDTDGAAVDVEKVADKEDGINLTAATTWITAACVIVGGAIVAFCVYLAKTNKRKSEEKNAEE